MAQYRFSPAIVSRGGGKSIIAKAAYNAREAIRDERTGELKDYSRKKGLEFSGIFAPKNAPEWATDRARLWNAVEQREDRSTRPDQAQLARSIEVNLPHELNAEQRRQLVRDFVREQFVRKGMIADVAIHAPDRQSDERNYHAHILLTLREIGPEGFGKKVREWNSKELNLQWREKWAELGARYLEKAGFALEAERYKAGHLTLEKQREDALKRGDREWAAALDREPTKHLGPHVSAMERRGVETEIGNAHRDTLQRNEDRATLHALKRELAELDRVIAAVDPEQVKRVREQLENQKVEKQINDLNRDTLRNLKRDLQQIDKLIAAHAGRENTGGAAGKEQRREAERQAAQKPVPVPTRGAPAEIRNAYQRSDSPRAFAAALEEKRMALAVVTKEEADRSHRQASFAKEMGNYAPRYREGEIVVVREPGPTYRQNGQPTEPRRVYQLNEYTTGHDRAAVGKFLAPLDRKPLRDIEATKRTLDDRAQKRRSEIAAAKLERATNIKPAPRTRTGNAKDNLLKRPAAIAKAPLAALNVIAKPAELLSNAIEGLFAPILTPEQKREGEIAARERQAEGRDQIEVSNSIAERAQERQQEEQREAARQRDQASESDRSRGNGGTLRQEPRQRTGVNYSRSLSGKRAVFHIAARDVIPPHHTPPHTNPLQDQPQRPGETGPMSKGEFYWYCKCTGQLWLFFARFPGG